MVNQTYPPHAGGKAGQRTMSAEEYRKAVNKDAPNAAASLKGLQNRQSGADFETLITAGCEHYAKLGLARIEKTPEPMAPVRRLGGGKFEAVYTHKAQGDYKGTLKGGRAIAFEAKHTSAAQISKGVVSDAQAVWLHHHHRLGALCFVVVSIRGREFFQVPWETWAAMEHIYGRKHMKLADLWPFAVPLDACKTDNGIVPGVHFLRGIGGKQK